MTAQPEVGMSIKELIGNIAEVITGSPMRGGQIENALTNIGTALEKRINDFTNTLRAEFGRVGAPEQPDVKGASAQIAQPAVKPVVRKP